MMLIVASVLVIGATVVALYFCVPWAYGRWSQKALRRRVVGRDVLVVTLDDGPGRVLTPAILQMLAAKGWKATFFLLGRNIRGNEDLVRSIRKQGHEIGSHSFDHLDAWKTAPWRCISDIRRGQKAIDEALGVSGGKYAFRPPRGRLNLATLAYLLAKRIPIVYWTIDCGDTWLGRPRYQDQAANLCRAHRGGVVLLHDFDRSTREVDSYVLGALQSVLAVAQDTHLTVSTSSQIRGTVQ